MRLRIGSAIGLLVLVLSALCSGTVQAQLSLFDDVEAIDPSLIEKRDPGKAVVRSEDIDNVSVMNLDGDYGRGLVAPRQEVAQRFFDAHADEFDFLVVFTAFEFRTDEALAFYSGIRNDVEGIGMPVFDHSAAFGSAGRLQGYIDMAAMSRYDFNSRSQGFRSPLNTLTHEIMHRWAMRLRFQLPDGSSSGGLIGRDGAHWSLLADTDASIMYGARWQQSEPGRWTIVESRQRLAPWDLYLAGLADLSELPGIGLLETSEVNSGDLPQVGLTVAGTQQVVEPAQVVAAEGMRVPAAQDAQRNFNAALILLLRPGQTPDPRDLARLERFRLAYEQYFQAITGGRATIRLQLKARSEALVSAPALITGSPVSARQNPVDAALQWIQGAQEDDGRWQDRAGSATRDTAAAIVALEEANVQSVALDRARQWITGQVPGNIDEQAWLQWALATEHASDPFRLNNDGGIGIATPWQSSPTDSARVLLSLQSARFRDEEKSARLAVFLRDQQNPDGSYGATRSGAGRVVLSALVAAQLLGRDDHSDREAGSRARNWVESRVDAAALAGPSYALSDVAELALRAGALDLPQSTRLALTQHLLSHQGESGDWGGSRYTTAIAALALMRESRPNLVAKSAVAAPAEPIRGEPVRLRLRIANVGGQATPTTTIQWYDGDPAQGGQSLGGAQSLPAMLAGDETVIDAWIETEALSGTPALHAVVDHLDTVDESREDDNSFGLLLQIGEPPASAELAIDARALNLTPPQFDRVPSTVQLSGTVRNLGAIASGPLRVRLVEVRNDGPATLAETGLEVAALSQAPFQFDIPIVRAEAYRLRVLVDPDNAVVEARETNNSADITLPFGDSVDLDLVDESLEVSANATIGSDNRISISIVNSGTRDSALSSIALERADGIVWQKLDEAALSVGAGQQVQRTLVWRPQIEGVHSLRLRLDPGELIAEFDETNNVLEFSQDVVRSDAPALMAIPAGIDLSPDPVREGSALRVTAGVRNVGSSAAPAFSVELFRGDPRSGGVRLARVRLESGLSANADTVAVLDVPDYAERGDASLFVHVDSLDEVAEGNETDNYGIREIVALALPDLAVTAGSITLSPAAPVPGLPVRAEVIVSNSGEQPSAGATARLSELKDGERTQVGGEIQLPAIAPGAVHLAEWEWTFGTLPDARALSVEIDRDNLLREVDETNNEATLLFDTQSSEAFVTEPYFSPNGDGIRDHTRAAFAQGEDITEIVVTDHAGRQRRRFDVLDDLGNGAVGVVWDGRDDAGSLVSDGRFGFTARSADGEVRGPVHTVLDLDRPMALEAVNSENGIYRALPASISEWVDAPEGTPGEHYVYATGDPNNPLAQMQRGVVRTHLLLGGIESVITARWLDEYAEQNDLISIESRQVEILSDGRLLIAMHEFGGANRTLIFAQAADDIDRPTFLAALATRSQRCLLGSIDAQRFLVGVDEPFAHSVLDLTDGSLRPMRPAAAGAQSPIVAIMPEGVAYSALNESTSTVTFIPYEQARPVVEIAPDSIGADGHRRILHLAETHSFLIHLHAGCRTGNRATFAKAGFEQQDNEGVFVVDARDGEWRRLLALASPNPAGCSGQAGRKALETPGSARLLSLRAFWLEHEREAVVIDHRGRRLLRFDHQARPLGQTALPSTLRIGDYARVQGGGNVEPTAVNSAEPAYGSSDIGPGLHPSWPVAAESRTGFESRYFDADARVLHLTHGELVYGDGWYGSGLVAEGTVDFLRVGWDGQSERLEGRTVWPLRASADAQNYPQVDFGTSESSRMPLAWPIFIHRNGTLLRRDGRVVIASQGRSTSPWPHASHLIAASASQSRLHLSSPGAPSWRTGAIFSTLERLTAELRAVSDGRRVSLSGVATDRNFDSYQIDWAHVATPDSWNVLVAATPEQVRFDDFLGWAPPQAGAYLIRLRVQDLAGNRRDRFASVEVGFGAPIGSVRQNLRHISPNGDAIQDRLELSFAVLRPTEQAFEIRDSAGRLVKREDFSFGVPELGARQWSWDGRNGAGSVVPDGRYRVELSSGFVFRVNVDTVAPLVDATLVLPEDHYDQRDLDGAVRANRPAAGVGPVINYTITERFAGLPGILLIERLESANLQSSAWTPIQPFALLQLETGQNQAALSSRQYAQQRFRVVAVDLAGNRTATPPMLSTPALLLVHAEQLSRELPVFQPAPHGRAENIPQYGLPPGIPAYISNDDSLPLFGLSLAGELLELTIDELRLGASGSQEWVARTTSAPTLVAGDILPNMQGHLVSAGLDLSGRQPGDAISLRLRGDYQNGSTLTSNALGFTVGGLTLNCPPAQFRATAYLEDPASQFLLEVGGSINGVDTVFDRLHGHYYPTARIVDFPNVDVNRLIGLHGLPRGYLFRFRATAIDGQDRFRTSDWITCPGYGSDGGAAGEFTKLEILPVFSATCDSAPSARVLVRYANLASQGEHQLVVRGPFLPQPQIQSVAASGELQFPVHSLPEGDYTMSLEHRGSPAEEWSVAVHSALNVDHRPPQTIIEAPAPGEKVCAATLASGVFAGIAQDARRLGVRVEYRPALGTTPFKPLTCAGYRGSDPDCTGLDFVTGQVTAFGGSSPLELINPLDSREGDEAYELRMRASDWSGGQVCSSVNVDIDAAVRFDERLPPEASLYRDSNWPTLSPLGEGEHGQARWFMRARERVDFRVDLHSAVRDSLASARARIVGHSLGLLGSESQRFGDIDFSWDGALGGSAVGDGLFGLRFTVTDDCGNELTLDRFVDVDGTPPTVELTRPLEDTQIRAATIAITARIVDPNFGRYVLGISQVSATGPWTTIGEGTRAVPVASVLAQWPTGGSVGPLWIRLRAGDLVENTIDVVREVALLPRLEVIRSAIVAPALFSPNDDARLDESEIRLELQRAAQLDVRVLDSNGVQVRTLADSQTAPIGPLTLVWNGRNELGQSTPDGQYVVEVRAVDAAISDNIDTQLLELSVDTTAPTISGIHPAANLVRCDDAAYFEVEDPHFAQYEATLEQLGSRSISTQGSTAGYHFVATMRDSIEGAYRFEIGAQDAAGNLRNEVRDFTLDCTPPDASLALESGSVVARVDGRMVSLRGRATDTNFSRYLLTLAPLASPTTSVTLGESSVPVTDGVLMQWQPTHADGDYRLTLQVEDGAGNLAEVHSELRIDGTAPVAQIDSPVEGQQFGGNFEMRGSASDQNFDHYRIEIATPAQAAANEWSLMRTGLSPVLTGRLTDSSILIQGEIVARLVVRDLAGLTSTDEVRFFIDTVPPPALALSGVLDDRRDVRLTWQHPEIPDLDEVRILRNGTTIDRVPAGTTSYGDSDLPEGEISYRVIAVDQAGNAGEPSNVVIFQVDRTPPRVALYTPRSGERIRSIYTIAGTATSSDDDLAEWELSLVTEGVDAELLRRSPAPINGGPLLAWDTRAMGNETPVRLRLQARDIAGNEAGVDVAVIVDNDPPGAPTGLAAVDAGPLVQVTWDPNLEADLLGYLLYRGGELVGYGGSLPADLRPLALAGNAYSDVGAPDGALTYRVYAIDEAGNISQASAPSELVRDAGPPDLEIVRPQSGEEFDDAIEILAQGADRDIAQVALSFRARGDLEWTALGSPLTQSPWRGTFEPEGLEYGEYELRALATDTGGLVDPDPPVVSVRYADLTPPMAPGDVRARADGSDVRVDWPANGETDLAGYRVEQRSWDGSWTLVANTVRDVTELLHPDLSTGEHSYRVLAFDSSGNLSVPSAVDRAHVFELSIDWPHTPVSIETTVVSGSSYDRGGELRYIVEGELDSADGRGAVVGEFEGFAISDVPLFVGSNTIHVRLHDSVGNVSIPASVSLRRGLIPQPPTGVSGVLDVDNVTLGWSPSVSLDVAGYRVFRNDRALWLDTRLSQPIESYVGGESRPEIVDQQIDTTWTLHAGSATAQLEYPSAAELYWDTEALVAGVRIRFADAARSARDYRIHAYSVEFGTEVLLAVRTGRSSADELVLFDSPYPANTLRIEFETAQAPAATVVLAEVEPLQRTPSGDTSYLDSVTDGRHRYEVSAVSVLGFESARSQPWTVDVGDAEAPPQVVLAGSVAGADVTLQWTESDAADLLGYSIHRDGISIASIAAGEPRTYLDEGLVNGRYVYTVTAEDEHFNQSSASNAVALDVSIGAPAPPTIVSVQQDGSNPALRVRWTVGAGAAVDRYRLFVSETAEAEPTSLTLLLTLSATEYLHRGLSIGDRRWYRVQALDARGNESALSDAVGGEVRDAVPPLTPSLTYPTQPGIAAQWREPTFDICGRTSPGSTAILARNGSILGEASARIEVGTQSLWFAPSASNTLLSADGRSVFLSGTYAWQSPGWYDADSGQSVEAVVRPQHDLEQVRMGQGGTVVVAWNQGAGEVWRFTRGVAGEEVIARFDDLHDVATNDQTDRILLLGDHEATSDTLFLYRGAATGLEEIALPAGRVVKAGSLRWQGGRGLFADTQGRVYSVDGESAVLAEIGGNATHFGPSPSPQGTAWLEFDLATTRLLRYNGEYASPQVLLDDDRVPLAGAWSPDGREIALRFEDRLDVLDATSGALLGSTQEPPLDDNFPYRLQWTNSWRILIDSGWSAMYPRIVDLPGTFCARGIAAIPGANMIEAIAENSSGLLSLASDPIWIDYLPDGEGTGSLPDLTVHQEDVSFFPAAPRIDEGRSMFLRVSNPGEQAAVINGAYLRATLRLPNGSERVFEARGPLNIEAGGEHGAGFDLGRMDQVGEYVLRIDVDPEQRTVESDEGNNLVVLEWQVTTDNRPYLSLSASQNTVSPGAPLAGEVGVFNPGATFAGEIVVEARDMAGDSIAEIDRMSVQALPSGSSRSREWSWLPPASLLAGTYRIHARLLRTTGAQIDQRDIDVRVLALAEISLTLQPQQLRSPVGQSLPVQIGIDYHSGNRIFDSGWLRLVARNASGTDSLLWEGSTGVLLPGYRVRRSVLWPAAMQDVGLYDVRLAFEADGESELAQRNVEFVEAGTPITVNGELNLLPSAALVLGGTPGKLSMVAESSSATSILGATLRVRVNAEGAAVPILEQQWSVDLMEGARFAQEMILDSLAPQPSSYVARLDMRLAGDAAGTWQGLSTLGFQTVDGEAPMISLVSPDAISPRRSPIAIAARIVDRHSRVDQASYRLDGGEWHALAAGGVDGYTTLLHGLVDGAHLLTIRATDDWGNEARNESQTFVVDSTPPTIDIGGVEAGDVLNVPATPVITIIDAHPDGYAAFLDGSPFDSGVAVNEEGPHRLLVRAIDRAGNRSDRSLEFVIDLTPPSLMIVSPADGSTTMLESVGVEVFTEPGARVRLSAGAFDGAQIADIDGAALFDAVPLQVGVNLMQAVATDDAGNAAAPVVIGVTRQPSTGELSGALRPTVVELPRGQNLALDGDVFNGTATSYVALPIRLRAIASNGNALFDELLQSDVGAGSSFSFSRTLPASGWFWGPVTLLLEADVGEGFQLLDSVTVQVVDATPPLLQAQSPIDGAVLRPPVAMLVFATDDRGVAAVDYRVDADDWATLSVLGGDTYAGDISPEDGVHSLRFRVLDAAGNEAASDDISFVADATAPQISVTGVADGETYAGAVIPEVVVHDANPDDLILTLDTQPFVSGTSVASHGAHRLVARAIDAAGNESQRNLDFAIDVQAPTVAFLQPSDGSIVTSESILVVGSSEANAEVRLALDAFEATVLANAKGIFSVTNVPLRLGENMIRATASDGVGNEGEAATLRVFRSEEVTGLQGTITAVPPSVIAGDDVELQFSVTERAGATRAALPLRLELRPLGAGSVMWTHDRSVALAANAVFSGSESAPTESLPLGDYLATLSAQHEGQWTALASTTVDIRDALGPSVTVFAPVPDSVHRDSVELRVGVIDESGIDDVRARVDGGDWQSLQPAGADEWSRLVMLPREGGLLIEVRATDKFGNVGTPAALSVRSDVTPPSIQIDGVSDGQRSRTPLTPLVTIEDASSIESTITLDGMPYTSGTVVSIEGLHTLSVDARDAVENRSLVSMAFEIDTQPPDVTISYPPDGAHVSAGSIDVLGVAESNAQVVLTVGSTTRVMWADGSGAFALPAVPLAYGDNVLTVHAVDAAGNVGEAVGVRVLRACGTVEQSCSLFGDGFEQRSRRGSGKFRESTGTGSVPVSTDEVITWPHAPARASTAIAFPFSPWMRLTLRAWAQ